MSLVIAKTIRFPDNSPVVPIVGSPEQFNPYVDAGSLRPWTVGGGDYDQGDGSGGSLRFTWDFRPAGDDRPVFVTINEMFGVTSSSAAQTLSLGLIGHVFEKPAEERAELNVAAPYYFTEYLVKPSNPLTLGKGVTNNVLQIAATFEVNTNAAYYLIFANGFISDRPFLTSRDVLPL